MYLFMVNSCKEKEITPTPTFYFPLIKYGNAEKLQFEI